MEKRCSKCGKVKVLTRFSKSSRHIGGINHICKTCISERSKRSYRKIEEDHLELTQKELEAKILYAEAAQAEWYREEGKDQRDSVCFYKEHAKLFWDKVESRNLNKGEG